MNELYHNTWLNFPMVATPRQCSRLKPAIVGFQTQYATDLTSLLQNYILDSLLIK